MKLEDIDLADPDNFVAGTPHHWLKELRTQDPVHWHPEKNGPGFWCVTKYEDVKTISRDPLLYSSWLGGTNIEDRDETSLAGIRMLMLNMDPPQHVKFRRIVQRGFTPQMVAKQEAATCAGSPGASSTRSPHKGECEFVERARRRASAAGHLRADGRAAGGSQADLRALEQADRLRRSGVPEQRGGRARKLRGRDVRLRDEARRAIPQGARRQPDHGSALRTRSTARSLPSSSSTPSSCCSLVAGNETTRTVTTNGMKALLDHPDQLARLVANPGLVPRRSRSSLRFDPAVHYFRRTATRDTELRGRRIREGPEGRDVVPVGESRRGRLRRAGPLRHRAGRQPHLAFGIGEHFCLGANLARLELVVVFQEILKRLRNPRLVSQPRRLRSNFVNGVKEMRIAFDPERN